VLLGIDVGTTAVKALVIDECARPLAEGEATYPTQRPHPRWSEQDAEDWWSAAVAATRQALAELNAPNVKGIAVSTQGDTLVPVDAGGRPLAPARTWMDTRTADLIGPIEMVVARDTWRAIAGASLGPYASAMSIAWLREHRPEVHKRTARFSLVQDFITQRLTGTPALDHPNASRTLLFDVRSRGWCPELMAAVGVGEDQLAPALPSGTCVGAICEAAAAELGLRPGTAVSLGGHDQTCAGIGAGVVKAGSMLLSCGTAWVLLASVDRPSVAVGDGGVQVYCHAAPDRWALLTAHAGGNVFAWCRDVLYGGANTGYEEIGAEAEQAASGGGEPLLVLPHFYGSSGSERLRDARGAVVGLTLGHTRGDLALGVMRGVVLEVLRNFGLMEAQGERPTEIRMIGGGARSALWAQMIADGTGVPVMRPAVREAASFGAAILAGVGAGLLPSVDEMVAVLPVHDRLEPRREQRGFWDGALERYGAAISALAVTHGRLAGGR